MPSGHHMIADWLTRTDCPPCTFDAQVAGIQADIQDNLAIRDTTLEARRRLCMADGPTEFKPFIIPCLVDTIYFDLRVV